MTVVTAASGYDLGYVWKGQAQGGTQREQDAGGYYINAAQAGEPPGRWFGKGAEALGLTAGQEVEREPYDAVYQQVDPRDGSRLGRKPGGYARYADHLARLMEAEPHATGERLAELERMAAQATRKSPAYTDVTVSFPKSVSVLHASIRENGRQARLAGDEATAAYWDAREVEYQQVLQDANRAGLEHLQQWAMTRTGYHGARVDGQEPGRFEPAGIVVTSWLQGTSRDGDPHDHVHNQIARMSLTARDGKWRAVDTMGVRAQLDAVRAIVTAHVESGLTRKLGVTWTPRADGNGSEIEGITREQIEAYSSRAQAIDGAMAEAVGAWSANHAGRQPTRRELQYIHREVWAATRDAKPEGAIDWDALAAGWDAKWEALDGTTLAQVAPKVSNLRGPGAAAAPHDPEPGGPAPSPDAQLRAMQCALARVQEKYSTWTRAQLMREMADNLPPEAHLMAPADAVALLHDMTSRTLAGEAEQVICLEAPEWPPVPDYLRRDLDGGSVYTRPGTERYATQVQLSREEQFLATAASEGAPHLAPEISAQLLGAEPEALAEAGHVRAQEATAQLPSGVRMGQAAALHAALTDPRTGYAIIGPAGSGKTHVAAMAARMWREAGMGDVIGAAPSQAARNVLADAAQIEAYNTAQLLGHLPGERGALGPMQIRPRTLILLDESSMTSLQDINDTVALAAANESKVLLLGDDGQLTAPEGGGGLALITREQEHAQLAEPVRFAAKWEGEASLRLRTGDAAVLTEYDQHGRIRGGNADQIMDEARKAYLAGYLAGRDVLLMAQSHETCRELSQRIRDDLQHLGLVERGAEAPLRNGARASVGDLILTRENDHRLGVANGDTWRVEAIDGDRITMRQLLEADRETGARRYADRTVLYEHGKNSADLAYVVDEHGDPARPTDLAYAITGHSGQGRTVWQGNALITGTETREWAYVALSRGVVGNYAYVVTEPARVADPAPGSRPAPELERHERIERERAGLPEPEGTDTGSADELAREPIAVLSDVIEREGAEYSALEVQRRNLANADHLAKLHAIWQGETKDTITGRYERSLREHLPEGYKSAKLSGHATWLWRTLRGAEAAGLDADDVLARAIDAQSLAGARDVAAVIDSRIREQIGSLVPQRPGPWAERVPEIEDSARQEYVTALAEAMDQRTERLGEFTAEAPPIWAARALGPVPDEPLARLDWERRAADVASYREMFGYDHPSEPIGPEPVNSPEARAAWHAAFAALGPVDDVDLAKATDGRLLNMRNSYEAETAWAPRYVGDELRQVRISAADAARDATLADAEARAARERGDDETAGLHEANARSQRAMEAAYRGHEALFAKTMEARAEWERNTERPRHLAIAANSEYRRRNPDAKLPPIKSAEPPKPSEEERAQLVPGGTEHETPAWVTELAERNRAAMEKLEERRGLRVPNEDHEWEDEGEAWPDAVRLERDAIIQPPKPEIRPAAEVAERAREMSGAGADREAGE